MIGVEPGLVAGAFGACLLSGVAPWISGEMVVAAGALALPPRWIGPLVAAAALGQAIGKLALFALARRCPERLPPRMRDAIDRIARGVSARATAPTTVFVGAAVGLPPLYLLTLAAGVAGTPAARFALPALAGSALRYGAVAWGAARVAGTLT